MKPTRGAGLTAAHAGNAPGIATRPQWAHAPRHGHFDDGGEVSLALDGELDMHPREARQAQVTRLGAGDIFFASAGAGHVAHPSGEARILMAGHEGSA